MKQIINRMELRFPSGSVNESFARGAVSAFVLCLDPLVTDLNDLKTAVSEAVTNAIVHGYRDTIGTVYITAVIYADGTVQVKVRDAAAASRISKKPWSRCLPPGERSVRGSALP